MYLSLCLVKKKAFQSNNLEFLMIFYYFWMQLDRGKREEFYIGTNKCRNG